MKLKAQLALEYAEEFYAENMSTPEFQNAQKDFIAGFEKARELAAVEVKAGKCESLSQEIMMMLGEQEI